MAVLLTTFNIKQNDRLPSLSATLTTVDGTAVDLTGGTVKLLMRSKGGSVKVNSAAVIVNPTSGAVRYDWGATDTDAVGTYQAEFEFTDGSGKKETFPNDGYLAVVITDDIA